MEIGVTVLPDPPYQRLVDLIGMAEEQGFESGWTYDSPILWQEPYPLLTLMIQRTKSMRMISRRMRFGAAIEVMTILAVDSMKATAVPTLAT